MFGSGNIEAALANSVIYLERAAISSSHGCGSSSCAPPTAHSGDFYDGKRQAERYFFNYELPKTA
jgi:hypothetical protein